ncbi:hypothetical protein COCCADRAFT_42312 [Bipolaris zeicola 26-R-13]|uniref:Aminoglycoside phosphotransferase domain-containing protein n=1 Tax=Cochliobolus carbonum (strain 26-R-13) TaxID=930089 RepID=W6XMX1_COCC2|nr:uncharacterized protein COCCADRAFT_42312 [Bipolaris zeicola 26-R-13]EUC26620.1 hypothetical protein COCCADRAFT_42312 [Bipolaris zeicola 26-R-13]
MCALLLRYIAELRRIPNKTGSGFQICKALGGGILNWRTGESQCKELRFQDESSSTNARKLVSESHSVKHDIAFTHRDLNLRNILVDDNGKISRIVNWECAGWYPKY